MADERICFVISPIGDPGSETRRRADQVLKHIIEPAATKCGYIALRSDKIALPGNITSQVIQHVLDDPIVVADLTGSNGNVFYELALRHVSRKPLVQIISEGEKIPFDVANMRTVHFDHRDLDSAQSACEEIEKQIHSVENSKPEQIETPITVSIDFQTLRQSDNPEQRSLAEVFSALNAIRGDIAGIQKRLELRNREPFDELDRLRHHLEMENATLRRTLEEKEYESKKRLEELLNQLNALPPQTASYKIN